MEIQTQCNPATRAQIVLAACGFSVLIISHTLQQMLRGQRFLVLEQTFHVILQRRKLELGNMGDMGPIVSQGCTQA